MKPLPLLLCLFAAAAVAAEPVKIAVKETAGLRRFGYPVRAVIPMTEAPAKDAGFRLTQNGKPVDAQFTIRRDGAVEIDFNVNLAPNEAREFAFEHGPGVVSSTPKAGMKLEQTDDEFRIVYGPGLTFVVPKNLLGLLKSVKTESTDYLRPDSAGLFIRYRDDIHYRVGGAGPFGTPTKATVVKSGPLVTTIRFVSLEALRGNRSVPSAVELEFPRSKSWVKLTWLLPDDEAFVGGMGMELNLNLVGEPVTVNFGAGDTVYAALKRGQSAEYLGGIAFGKFGVVPIERPWWRVSSGPTGALTALAEQPRGQDQAVTPGWAHAMDKQRCTAIAIEKFSFDGAQDRIEISAEGRLRLWRDFALDGRVVPNGKKTWTVWLHFVGMPVEVGAATSPQSILAAPKVTLVK